MFACILLEIEHENECKLLGMYSPIELYPRQELLIHTRISIHKIKKLTATDRTTIDLSTFCEVIISILENKVKTY